MQVLLLHFQVFPGKSAVVIASGFLTPSANQNGAAFGLLAVLADGTAFMLGNVTSIDENTGTINFGMYPNPANDMVMISLPDNETNAIVEITNSLGQVVLSQRPNNSRFDISLKNFVSGVYFVNVQTPAGKSTSKLIVQ